MHLGGAIAYYMQKGGERVQIACKIAYVINGRSRTRLRLRIGSTAGDRQSIRLCICLNDCRNGGSTAAMQVKRSTSEKKGTFLKN